jgi:hypothetical protein
VRSEHCRSAGVESTGFANRDGGRGGAGRGPGRGPDGGRGGGRTGAGRRALYRGPVDLVAALRQTAERAGRPLPRLGTGSDRLGPVGALLLDFYGYISVRAEPDGGYTVMVFGGDLEAWGHTTAADDVVATMHRWQQGASAADLRAAGPYLTVAAGADTAVIVEALWQVLLHHGQADLAGIVAAAAAEPRLRGLRPWVGHGTLYLHHPHDRIGAEDQRGLAFHPADGGRFTVDVYRGEASPALDAGAAAGYAAEQAPS